MAAPGVIRGQRGRKSPSHTPWDPDSVQVQVKGAWESGGTPRSWEVTRCCLGLQGLFQAQPRPCASPAIRPIAGQSDPMWSLDPPGRLPGCSVGGGVSPGRTMGDAGPSDRLAPSAHTCAARTGGDLALGDQRAEYLSAVSLWARGRGTLWAPKELPGLLFSPKWS